MKLKTASSVVNYIVGIETASAGFYLACAERHPDLKALFGQLAGENQKFAKRVKKAYYSAVTDALETNFGFKELNATVGIPEAGGSESAPQTLTLSLALENSVRSFYCAAAEQSMGLLADVPKAMMRLVREREKRIQALEARLQPL